MARTRKGAKGAGYEWDRRPWGKRGWISGPDVKAESSKARRRIGRLMVDDARERAAYCPECHGEGCPRCLTK